MDFVGRQHWSVILQDADHGTVQNPALGGVPESTVIRAVEEQVPPDNNPLEFVRHSSYLPACRTFRVLPMNAPILLGC